MKLIVIEEAAVAARLHCLPFNKSTEEYFTAARARYG